MYPLFYLQHSHKMGEVTKFIRVLHSLHTNNEYVFITVQTSLLTFSFLDIKDISKLRKNARKNEIWFVCVHYILEENKQEVCNLWTPWSRVSFADVMHLRHCSSWLYFHKLLISVKVVWISQRMFLWFSRAGVENEEEWSPHTHLKRLFPVHVVFLNPLFNKHVVKCFCKKCLWTLSELFVLKCAVIHWNCIVFNYNFFLSSLLWLIFLDISKLNIIDYSSVWLEVWQIFSSDMISKAIQYFQDYEKLLCAT